MNMATTWAWNSETDSYVFGTQDDGGAVWSQYNELIVWTGNAVYGLHVVNVGDWETREKAMEEVIAQLELMKK